MSFSDKLKNIFKIDSAKRKLDQAMAKVADVAGNKERAEDLYQEILLKEPNNVDALLNLAVIRFENSDFDNSFSFFKQAQKNSDELSQYSAFSDTALLYYAYLCLKNSEASTALQALENKEFKKKYYLDSLLVIFFSYSLLGEFEKQIDLLFKLHTFFYENEWNSNLYTEKEYLNIKNMGLSDSKKSIKKEEISKITALKLLDVFKKLEKDRTRFEYAVKLYNRDNRLKNQVLDFLCKNINDETVSLDFYKFSAMVWEKENDYKKHVQYLKMILELVDGQKRLPYLKKLAKCYVKLKAVTDYQKCLSEIIKIDPDDCERAANYCEILIRDKKFSVALNILEKTNCSNNKRCMDILGKLYFSEKKFAKALTVFKSLKDMSTENINYIKLTGFCLLELKKVDQAMTHFEKVIQLNGLDPETGLRLMDIYVDAVRPDHAFNIIKEGFSKKWFSKKRDKGKKCFNKSAAEFLKKGLILFEKCLNIEKKRGQAAKLGLLLGNIFEETDDITRALFLYRKSWKCNPESLEIGMVLSRVLYKEGYVFEVINIYKKLLQRFESDLIPSWSYDNFKPLLQVYQDQMLKIVDLDKKQILLSFFEVEASEKIKYIGIIPDFCDLSIKLGNLDSPLSIIDIFLSLKDEFLKIFMEKSEDFKTLENRLLSLKILILFRKNEIDKGKNLIDTSKISYEYRLKILKSAMVKGHQGFVLGSELNNEMENALKGKNLIEYLYIIGICNETAMNYKNALEKYRKIMELISDYRDVSLRIERLEANEKQ